MREIELVPVAGGHNGDGEEESRRFRITLIFLTGIGRGDGMPGNVFRLVLDLLIHGAGPAYTDLGPAAAWNGRRRGTSCVGIDVQSRGRVDTKKS